MKWQMKSEPTPFLSYGSLKRAVWNLTLGNTITTFQKESASESIMSWPLCIFFWSVEVIGSLEILLLCKSSRSSSNTSFPKLNSTYSSCLLCCSAFHNEFFGECCPFSNGAASILTTLLNKRVWGGENLFFKIQI